MKTRTLFVIGLGFLALAGCKRQETPQPAAVWDWNAFPSEERVLVAELSATASSARTEILRAPATGALRLSQGLDLHQPLTKDEIWATIEPTDTGLENETIAQLEAELVKRHQRFLNLERPSLLAQLDRDLRSAGETAAAATFAERQPELFKGERPVLDPVLRPALPAAQLADLVRSLRERREQLASDDPSAEPGDLQNLRSEIDRLRRNRDQHKRTLQLATPFPGTLALADPQDGHNVVAGTPVAVLSDPSVLRLQVRANGPLLLGIPTTSLEIEANLPGGSVIHAPFVASSFELGDHVRPVLWFETKADAQIMQALGSVGVDVPVRVFQKLPAAARIVSKLLIARYDSQGALAVGWRDAIPKLFPGTKFVAEGRTTVALQPAAP